MSLSNENSFTKPSNDGISLWKIVSLGLGAKRKMRNKASSRRENIFKELSIGSGIKDVYARTKDG